MPLLFDGRIQDNSANWPAATAAGAPCSATQHGVYGEVHHPDRCFRRIDPNPVGTALPILEMRVRDSDTGPTENPRCQFGGPYNMPTGTGTWCYGVSVWLPSDYPTTITSPTGNTFLNLHAISFPPYNPSPLNLRHIGGATRFGLAGEVPEASGGYGYSVSVTRAEVITKWVGLIERRVIDDAASGHGTSEAWINVYGDGKGWRKLISIQGTDIYRGHVRDSQVDSAGQSRLTVYRKYDLTDAGTGRVTTARFGGHLVFSGSDWTQCQNLYPFNQTTPTPVVPVPGFNAAPTTIGRQFFIDGSPATPASATVFYDAVLGGETTRLNERSPVFTPQVTGTLDLTQFVDVGSGPVTLTKNYPITPATQPPAPTMTTPTMTTSAITLNWTLPTDATRSGINVYRRVVSSGAVTKLNPSALGAAVLTYVDTTPAKGVAYDYFTRTINASSIESVNSNTVTATLTSTTIKARDLDLTFSSTTDPLIAELTGTNQITAGQLQQRVDLTVRGTEMRTVPVDVVDDGIVWVTSLSGAIGGDGDVEDNLGILIDANNRILAKRHTTVVAGAVTYDKLEARMVEGGTDLAQQAFTFPAGTNAVKIGFLADTRTAIFMASTDGGATFPNELTRRTLTTANFSGPVQVYERLNINSGSPTVGVSVTDRIYGTDIPGTTTAPTSLGDFVRTFNAGTDELRFPLAHEIGPKVTFVGQIRKTGTGRQQVMGLAPNTSGGKGYFVQVEASTGTNAGMISWRDGAADVVGGNGGGDSAVMIALSEFDTFAVSKDMTTGLIRTHVFSHATGLWKHSTSQIGPYDSGNTPIPATGHFYLGKGYSGSTEAFGGGQSLGGYCEKVMTDLEVESMVDANGVLQVARAIPALVDGLSTSQAKLYRLDGSDATVTVADEIGAANQDGRSGTTATTMTDAVPLITGTAPTGDPPDVVGDTTGLGIVGTPQIDPGDPTKARIQAFWDVPAAQDIAAGVTWQGQVGISGVDIPLTWAPLVELDTQGTPSAPVWVTGFPIATANVRFALMAKTTAAVAARSTAVVFTTPSQITLPTPPTVSGAPVTGQVIVASAGVGWTGSPTNFVYTFTRDGTPIAGATNQATPTYTLVSGDVGHAIGVIVGARYADGSLVTSPSSNSLTPTAPAEVIEQWGMA
jgi:hypothetical protein